MNSDDAFGLESLRNDVIKSWVNELYPHNFFDEDVEWPMLTDEDAGWMFYSG
jgi:hypothetical protein